MTITSPRSTITTATWSIQTMYETGKAAQAATKMRNCNLLILKVSQVGLALAGQRWLTAGKLLLHSGHEQEDVPHTQGLPTGPDAVQNSISTHWMGGTWPTGHHKIQPICKPASKHSPGGRNSPQIIKESSHAKEIGTDWLTDWLIHVLLTW